MAVAGASMELGGGAVFVFALQWVWVRSSCVVVPGAQRDAPRPPAAAPPCRPRPRQCSDMEC